jgi:hypothetical protein
MEKRRNGVRLAFAAALALPAFSQACIPSIEGTRLESGRYVLAYRAEKVEVARHFALDIAACAKPGNPAPESLKVDAHMPEHRHGMNYAPAVKALGPGRWRAEGLMLHMPGRWEFVFELRSGGRSERLARSLTLSRGLDFSPDEVAKILQHGPWPPPLVPDPSNRVSGKPEAVALGERLSSSRASRARDRCCALPAMRRSAPSRTAGRAASACRKSTATP